MRDIVFLGVILAVFAAGSAAIRGCARLIGGDALLELRRAKDERAQ
jgi:hypothetical protein